ncbi:hypothetical protein [Streptomyces sp. MS2.AVA.5]|uniref:Uncharacterized protein n=1 Tax=Streptomyces achmelvichensis TaxID=3134111 RepID=A0ACC6Q8Y1_9ACTN
MKDAARLSAVVLFAKSRAPHGRADDNVTSIRGPELGRWLGMTESTVHHAVLPALRKAGTVRTRVVTDEQGQSTGLDCVVMPLWQARRTGGVSHPLSLSRVELATLLRLLEALFGPGWTPKGKEVIAPGLLAGRRGRGAATDRLGLLLMVLNTGASGWLQLCGGSVVAREGRGAATLARLLGCTPSGARKVLSRLKEAGVVGYERKRTDTRMNGRGRVKVLPFADAYGKVESNPAAAEASETSLPALSDRPDAAVGDHGAAGDGSALATPGLLGTGGVSEAGGRERPAGAELHTFHASVATTVPPPAVSGRFSGEGRGSQGSRPERVCAREDRAVDSVPGVALIALPGAEAGPLRREKPKASEVVVSQRQKVDAAGAASVRGMGARNVQQRRGVAAPGDLRLQVALAPVARLWSRLNGGQRRVARRAVEQALDELAGLTGAESAPRLLAERLADRLTESGGEAMVREPMGWLLGRGVAQRRVCADRRCDDSIRLDTGDICPTCGDIVYLRRLQRARIAAGVDAELPQSDEQERRATLENRLRTAITLEAENLMARRQQAEADRACRAEASIAAEAEHVAAHVVREALPCADCGRARAAGLCEACGYRRRTETLVAEAGLVAAVGAADPTDRAGIAAVVDSVRKHLETAMSIARARFLDLLDPAELTADLPETASAMAFNELQTVQQAATEYRRSTLATLARTPGADAEAKRAYRTEQQRRHHRWYPGSPIARAAAETAAEQARARTARHLLATRLEQVRELSSGRTDTAAAPALSADHRSFLDMRMQSC